MFIESMDIIGSGNVFGVAWLSSMCKMEPQMF
jgi:fructoselysine-6-P-deglycase FrlB-like protein